MASATQSSRILCWGRGCCTVGKMYVRYARRQYAGCSSYCCELFPVEGMPSNGPVDQRPHLSNCFLSLYLRPTLKRVCYEYSSRRPCFRQGHHRSKLSPLPDPRLLAHPRTQAHLPRAPRLGRASRGVRSAGATLGGALTREGVAAEPHGRAARVRSHAAQAHPKVGVAAEGLTPPALP